MWYVLNELKNGFKFVYDDMNHEIMDRFVDWAFRHNKLVDSYRSVTDRQVEERKDIVYIEKL